jgi:DNA-directed RNA polymerase subunit RPC12/RpoP
LRIQPWTIPKDERDGRDRSDGLVTILELNGSQVPDRFRIWSPRLSAWDPPRPLPPGSLFYVCANCGGVIAYGSVYVGDPCPHCHVTFIKGGGPLGFRPQEPEDRR